MSIIAPPKRANLLAIEEFNREFPVGTSVIHNSSQGPYATRVKSIAFECRTDKVACFVEGVAWPVKISKLSTQEAK